MLCCETLSISERGEKINYIVYNKAGKILRKVICPHIISLLQAGDGEFVMEGSANDVTQKIKNPGIAGEVIDKTPEEIEEQNPTLPDMPFEKRLAGITNEQWQAVLDRLENLENS